MADGRENEQGSLSKIEGARGKIQPEFKHCKACKEGIKLLLPGLRGSDQNAFPFHIDVGILSPLKSSAEVKKEKRRTLRELERLVSGLQNTKGGVILAHFIGLSKTDKYLGHFDESLQDSFIHLIGDNDLYTNIYERQWLSHPSDPYTSFLRLNVKKTEGVSTVDYNTKLRTDCSNLRPLLGNIVKLIEHIDDHQSTNETDVKSSDTVIDTSSPGTIPTEEDLHECRNTEVKALFPSNLKGFSDSGQVADYIWENLKLKENVTSMSKVKTGGTVYFGIDEEPRHKLDSSVTYASKALKISGYPFQNPEDIVSAITRKIHEQISVVDCKGIFTKDTTELGICHVDYVDHKGDKKYVIRVFIRHFEGIVFHDKEGPRAYFITNGEVKRMEFERWYQEIRKCLAKSRTSLLSTR